MIRYLLAILTLIISALPSMAFAAKPPRTVQVELLLFRHTQATAQIEEWQPSSLINTSNAIELVIPEFSLSETQTPNYSLMPTDQLLLNQEETRLRSASDYQVLLHVAWTQPLEDTWHSKPVHVIGGSNYTIEGELANEIDGTVSISQGKFINFKSEINITEPSDTIRFAPTHQFNPFSSLPTVLSYHLIQSRRMKVGELNYLDNPYFGVLVRVTPVKVVAMTESAEGSSPQVAEMNSESETTSDTNT